MIRALMVAALSAVILSGCAAIEPCDNPYCVTDRQLQRQQQYLNQQAFWLDQRARRNGW